jgi:hypothetical protein
MKKQQTATLLISDEIEIILNEQTRIKILVQIIFCNKDINDGSSFVLDVIEHQNTEIYYNDCKLPYSYRDDNCPHKKFIQFYSSIGIDVNEVSDTEFENWEKAQKENGYFDNLLNTILTQKIK